MLRICALVLVTAIAAPLSADVTIPDKTLKTEWIGNGGRDYTGQQRAFDHKEGLRVKRLAVRWDGDKIRGIKWTLTDNSARTYGGFNDVDYALDTFEVPENDPLKSVILRDSGYGYNSFRQIEIETMGGVRFKAGPDGFDNEVRPPVRGGYLIGFHGLVNPDNFMQALGLWVSLPPAEIKLGNVMYEVGVIQRGTPEQVTILNLNADNRSGTTPMHYKSAEKVKTTSSHNWTSDWQVKTGVKVSVEASVPLVSKVGVEWSAEASHSQTTGEASSVENTTTVAIDQVVPAGKYGRIEIIGFRAKASVPYTANVEITYADGTKERIVEQRGLFLGASTNDVTVKYVEMTE